MNTQLNQEQIDAVVEWMMYFNIGSPSYHQFRKDFAPKDVTKEAEHLKNVKHRKNVLKEIISHFNSPFMGMLKMDIEDESEIKIGDRVKLKGDSNSPEMTVTRDCAAEAQVQRGTIGKGVQEETKYSGTDNNDPYAIFECSYFEPKEDGQELFNNGLKQYKFHKDALQKLIPTQPSNK